MAAIIERPANDEYGTFHAGYIQRVPEGDVITQLKNQIELLQQSLNGVNEDDSMFRPGPDEWSIKQVVGHLSDCERVFVYRATCFSRNDLVHLPSFDQDDYVREANYDARPYADLLNEWIALRQATVYSFQAITPDVSKRRGTVNGTSLSVRALIYITVGHVYHRLDSFHKDYRRPAV